jgi:hypothetical protein
MLSQSLIAALLTRQAALCKSSTNPEPTSNPLRRRTPKSPHLIDPPP